MEHRWSERAPATIRVLVYQDGVPIALGCTRNLSPQGAFVDLRGLDFQPTKSITVEFLTGPRVSGEQLRLAAMVVHVGTLGVGVMFLNLDAEIAGIVRSLMEQAMSATAASTPPAYFSTADQPGAPAAVVTQPAHGAKWKVAGHI